MALVNGHLSDGRDRILGGEDPTFADIAPATAIAFFKFPVNNTQERDGFRRGYAEGGSGL